MHRDIYTTLDSLDPKDIDRYAAVADSIEPSDMAKALKDPNAFRGVLVVVPLYHVCG
ncbi:MAG: hypothetical protein ACREXR_11625 [Gammaproteobacteria bacterium]